MTEEVKKPEDKQDTTQNQQQIVETPKETEAAPDIKSESNKENWRKFREEREKERSARAEAEKIAAQKQAEAEALKAAMESILNKPQAPQDNQYHPESDEDVIEKKVAIALQRERERIKQEQYQEEQKNLPNRLNETYRDFNHVCSSENLDYFEYHYPEIAKPYRYMPDGFDKWSSIYQAVKRFVPQDHKQDNQRMQENASKPKSVAPSMIDTKPQTVGWRLSEERKRENWERMQKDMKSFG